MEGDTITYENLVLSTYETEHILSIDVEKEKNQHAILHVTAILSEDKAEEYLYTTGTMTPVILGYQKEDTSLEILFRGIVTSVKIVRDGDVYYMDLYVQDNTWAMDIIKCSRSFQNVGMTTHQLISEVMAQYEGGSFKLEIPDEPIGKLVIQYKETDWEFLKRFVSRYGAVIIPDVRAAMVAYYVGIPEQGDIYESSAFQYSMRKSMDEYLKIKENKWNDVDEIDYIVFQIKESKVLQVGDQVRLGEKNLHVEKANHILSDGILKNTYLLKRRNGFKCLESHNLEIIGASISGRVADVSRDKVMVDLEIDEVGKAAYWFPYSTMSASPDGSGWYCMPEKGDQVRVYFPTNEESESYAVSSISGYQPSAGDTEDAMSNPNVKYLQTASDQVIKFEENGIIINSGSGQATIFLGNTGEVSLYGNNNINVTAQESLSLVSQSQLLLGAQESVTLKNEAGANITLDSSGNISIAGSKIYSN
jgi:Uncharacterized protein conserved in bacteria